MSCRILGRGVEAVFLNKIIFLLRESGVRKIYGEYIPTNKNIQVENFYSKNNFIKEKT